jgi:hypothetical protein
MTTTSNKIIGLRLNQVSRSSYPEYREPVLVKDVVDSHQFERQQEAITYTTEKGMQVAVVYLHELCEVE